MSSRESDIAHLMDMFPGIHKLDIEEVYDSQNKSLFQTSEYLAKHPDEFKWKGKGVTQTSEPTCPKNDYTKEPKSKSNARNFNQYPQKKEEQSYQPQKYNNNRNNFNYERSQSQCKRIPDYIGKLLKNRLVEIP